MSGGDVTNLSIVVHTTVPFGLQNLEADKDQICSNIVLPALYKLLPELPTPVEVNNHRWRYSQARIFYY